jgi:uncharacterized membrane protein
LCAPVTSLLRFLLMVFVGTLSINPWVWNRAARSLPALLVNNLKFSILKTMLRMESYQVLK